MKTKLLLALLTIVGSSYGQTPLHQWSFTNGSLSDTGSATTSVDFGAPVNVTTTADFEGNTNNAIQINTNITTGSTGGNSPINITMGNNFGTDYYRLVLGFNIKTSTNDSNERIILDQISTGANANGYQVSLVDGKIRLKTRIGFSNSNNFEDTNGTHPTNIADGEWHRIVIIVEYRNTPSSSSGSVANFIRTYVDNDPFGILERTNGRFMFRFLENTSELVLGNNNNFTAPNTRRYSDEIDNIEILEDNFVNIPDNFYFLRQQPITLFVNANATGTNDGSSWTNAFTSLKDAIDSSIPGDEIWVANGTYNPGANRTDTFFLKNRVKIYGGFNGTETSISDRDILNNITVLSGDVLGNDSSQLSGINDATRTDNNHRILRASEDNIIDGFTFTGGHASLRNNDFDKGAAIFKNRSSTNLSVKNCKFVGNYSYVQGAVAGIYEVNSKFHFLLVENCEFSGNQSNYGSGFSTTLTGNSSTLNVTVTNSLFHNNKAEQTAPGNSITGSAFSVLTSANRSGNIVNIVINNSTITKNNDTATITSAMETGPVMFRSGTSRDQINVTLNNSIITQNTNVGSTKPHGTFSRGNTSNKISSLTLNNSKVDETASGGFSGNSLVGEYSFLVDSAGFTETNMLDSSTNVTFNDSSNNDFKLASSDTPLIDSGNNSFVPAGAVADLANNIRIHNNTVDMGCFEFDAPSATLSVNNIDDQETIKLSVYPNPTMNLLNIESKEILKKVTLIDVTGRLIELDVINNQTNLKSLPQGIYFLKITFRNGFTEIKKILKI